VTPDELEDWRRVVFDIFQKACPIDRLRALRDGDGPGWDQETWDRLSGVGLSSAHLPESLAGGGGGLAAAAVVLEACGHFLVPEPFTSSFLATTFVLHSSEPCNQELLTAGKRLTVAVPTRGRSVAFDPDGAAVVVFPGQCGTVDTAVELGERGVLVDGRRIAAVIGGSAEIVSGLNQALAEALVGLSCELLGVAEAAFDLTSTHVRDRRQFGVTLASFQALQHRLARLYIELVLTRAVVRAAIVTPSPRLAAAAKARAGALALHVTAEGIQLHGGFGMTDEADIGLYFKRAWVLDQILGDATQHRARFGELLYPA
jgi:alkylation response protein AidB-like acyl-CoA dehydrogenase